LIVSAPGTALALVIAQWNDPTPVSKVLMTTLVTAGRVQLTKQTAAVKPHRMAMFVFMLEPFVFQNAAMPHGRNQTRNQLTLPLWLPTVAGTLLALSVENYFPPSRAEFKKDLFTVRAVATNCGQIKTGSLNHSDRLSKARR
jgi:hypothetical protein